MTRMPAPEYVSKVWRIGLVYLGFLVFLLAVGWKLYDLQFVKKEFLQGEGRSRVQRTVPIKAHRGMITDRNGQPLAVTTPVKTIVVEPALLVDSPAAIANLARVLELDAPQLAARLESRVGRKEYYIKRHIPPQEADKVMALGYAGVKTKEEYQRYYPQGEMAAHLVGFSDIDDDGQEGMELAYNAWLSGVAGTRQVTQDRNGNIIEEISILESPQPGKNLELSIDFRLQSLAYRALKKAVVTHGARSGSVVVMDADTSEVLALVNQPSYNPNRKSSIRDLEVLKNLAITEPFEPGSTAKVFTALAALESGKYQPESLIDTSPGWMMLNGYEVREHNIDYGVLSVEGVLTKSSNIGSTLMALEVGGDALREMFSRVGFGQGLGTGFPLEDPGLLRSNRLSKIEIANLSFGYGFKVTALQLAQAYTTLAADGIHRPVSLIKLDQEALARAPQERVIDERLSRQMLAMLESVVDPAKGGTARQANVPFYSVSGKTGTAEVHVENIGYQKGLHNSLFAGMAPAKDPRIVVAIIIYEPQGKEQYGGEVSAPVFSEIVSGAMRVLNVPPDNFNESEHLIISARH